MFIALDICNNTKNHLLLCMVLFTYTVSSLNQVSSLGSWNEYISEYLDTHYLI